MADFTVGVAIQGATQLRELGRRFKGLGAEGGALKKRLQAAIADAGRPVVAEVKQAARGIPVKGTPGGGSAQRREAMVLRARSVAGARRAARRDASLRAAIAGATGLRQTKRGIQIVVSARQMAPNQETLPRHMDSPRGWRHPVFGDTTYWVHQAGHPYFYTTIDKRAATFRFAIQKAMDQTQRELER
jgi:hypothetical protein